MAATALSPQATNTNINSRSTRKEQMREALLDAAITCFEEWGYAGTSIVKIAEQAGTTRPTFYAYFPSKVEIASAIFERFQIVFQPLFEPLDTMQNPSKKKISACLHTLLSYWEDYRPLYEALWTANLTEQEVGLRSHRALAELPEIAFPNTITRYRESERPLARQRITALIMQLESHFMHRFMQTPSEESLSVLTDICWHLLYAKQDSEMT